MLGHANKAARLKVLVSLPSLELTVLLKYFFGSFLKSLECPGVSKTNCRSGMPVLTNMAECPATSRRLVEKSRVNSFGTTHEGVFLDWLANQYGHVLPSPNGIGKVIPMVPQVVSLATPAGRP